VTTDFGRALRVVHVVDSLRTDYGGTSRAIPHLCESLAEGGCEVELVTKLPDAGEPSAQLPAAGVLIHAIPKHALGLRRAVATRVRSRLANADLLHDHGIWLFSNHVAAAEARRASKPRIVSPHGMLAPWSLAHRGWRKRIAWRLYQLRDLQSVAVFHATSTAEYEEIRAAGFSQPVAVIPNAVPLPVQRDRAAARPPGQPHRALFLSRLHPKKGVAELLEAWAKVRPRGWELLVVGPGEAAFVDEIHQRAQSLGLSGIVHFVDEVNDDEKWTYYGRCDLFVLPTMNENFGLVIAEALGSGLPVITTSAAPWPWLESERCGWWIAPRVADLAHALRTATNLAPSVLHEMGQRGRRQVQIRFGTREIAAEMINVYRWITGHAERPATVVGS
jgi:glycosyltransferase involved in cell wall biosynthesis